ncbi:MAG: ATP-dependent 6-phosphofructokinase, partial [Acidobacteria bacterium]|nr:ATP-dependent 6-phosphofructokinase [Acidobacteriota bacterium]
MAVTSAIRRIAIATGGGDAPGLNAVIRAVVLSALNRGWECLGIREGFNGLLSPGQFYGNGLVPLSRESVRGITPLGGTILGTTNRGDPLRFPVVGPDGTVTEVDRSDEIIEAFERHEIDALISVGGDGSLGIAAALANKGLRVVGVPKTIDNDLDGTVVTFGFDTAVSFATEAIDRLHSTAEAHGRVMVVEVMGRYAGWIALNAGVSATADVILIPEIPYDLAVIARKLAREKEEGRKYSIIVVAEGARPKGGTVTVIKGREVGTAERLGGVAARITAEIEELTGRETRSVVLGHLLRGGSPSTFDRLLSLRFGAAAVRALAEG